MTASSFNGPPAFAPRARGFIVPSCRRTVWPWPGRSASSSSPSARARCSPHTLGRCVAVSGAAVLRMPEDAAAEAGHHLQDAAGMQDHWVQALMLRRLSSAASSSLLPQLTELAALYPAATAWHFQVDTSRDRLDFSWCGEPLVLGEEGEAPAPRLLHGACCMAGAGRGRPFDAPSPRSPPYAGGWRRGPTRPATTACCWPVPPASRQRSWTRRRRWCKVGGGANAPSIFPLASLSVCQRCWRVQASCQPLPSFPHA